MKETITQSAEETRRFGRALGDRLAGGELVLLTGSMGTGKSVVARGIGDALDIAGWRGSPTFTIVNEYSGRLPLYHIDLYRLSPPEIEDLGLEEYVRPESVVVVEWADRDLPYLENLGAARIVRADLALLGAEERRIRLEEG